MKINLRDLPYHVFSTLRLIYTHDLALRFRKKRISKLDERTII